MPLVLVVIVPSTTMAAAIITAASLTAVTSICNVSEHQLALLMPKTKVHHMAVSCQGPFLRQKSGRWWPKK